MQKKLLVLLCLFSQIYSSDPSPEYKAGKDAANGAMDAAGERIETIAQQAGKIIQDSFKKDGFVDQATTEIVKILESKEAQKIVVNATAAAGTIAGEIIGQAVKEGITQAGSAFDQGQEADKAMQKASQSARRGINTASDQIGKGIEESSAKLSDIITKSGEDATEKAGDFVDHFAIETRGKLGKGSEFAKTVDEVSNITLEPFKKAAWELLHKNLIYITLISTAGTAAYFTIAYGSPVMWKMLERRWTRPKLIIESSKSGYSSMMASLFSSTTSPLSMIFSPALKEQLDDTIKVTSAIQAKIKAGKTNVKYRNLLLYGPPGTGKTMFAKELAKRSGLEYAFMSGSSFSKFKEGEGIEALDELFAWAKRSNGLMIFIDEAETFLSKRDNMDPQSRAYQLLNNFLNYTGERSDRFMIVFATNHQDALDSAMYRRIDDLIEMPLPCKMQRAQTLELYTNKILMDVVQNGKPFVDSVVKYLDNKSIDDIAERTKGLSYGDLEGIVNTLKTDSDILTPALISPALIDKVVTRAIKKHQTFTNGQPLGTVED